MEKGSDPVSDIAADKIAKQLSENQREALMFCNPFAGRFADNRTVKALVRRGLYEIGAGITTLGQAVRYHLRGE